MTHQVKIGDSFLLVPAETRSEPFIVTVSEVGRRWFTVTPGKKRFDKTTLESEDTGFGYNSHGKLYRDRAEYDALLARRAAWAALARDVSGLIDAPWLTTDEIRDVHARLFPSEAAAQANA